MDANIATADLFQPVRLGPLTLKNRVVMAPLTRSRAGAGDVPREMNARYYAQRASAGLIVSEASQISPAGKGYAWTPGIYSDDQIAGWRLVTDAVHEAGGHIFCQLWHVGRISHPDLQPGGGLPVAPSAIRPDGKAFTETGFKPHVEPHALTTDEIAATVADYAHAARAARDAGFDGVEIHGANGYLIDQFLKTKTNHRTDAYGGPLDNRLRFLREVVDAVLGAWEPGRVGIRLSPETTVNDIDDADPAATFAAAVALLNECRLVYLHFIEGVTGGPRDIGRVDYHALRRSFHGLYMANNGYTPALAATAIHDGEADLVAFGKPWISNPDLVERLRTGAPLAEADKATFYGGGEHGYTDYPRLDAAA